MITRMKQFLDESRQEFKRVNWPTMSETIRLTTIVIVFALFIALVLGVLDSAFTFLLSKYIGI